MFDKILKPALAAGLAITAISAPVSAQVNGIGFSDIGLAVANSQALRTGFTQINTTYQAQITQAEQLNVQRRQLLATLDTNSDGNIDENERAALTEDNATVQQIGTLEQQIAEANAPAQMARLYVVNQVGQQYRPAVERVMSEKSISLMVAPEAVDFAADEMNVTEAVVTALDTVLPTASITPPQGWQPNQATVQLLQQVQQVYALFAAQQQQQQGAAGAAAPAGDGVRRN